MTFRCPAADASCNANDAIRADGFWEDGYHFDGVAASVCTKKGCQRDGAFVQFDAIALSLISDVPQGPVDRRLVFDFGTPLGTPNVTPCAMPAEVEATQISNFRFDTPSGFQTMDEGEQVVDIAADDVIGIPAVINFTPIAAHSLGTLPIYNVWLAFGDIAEGNKVLVRGSGADSNKWTLTSNATVDVHCYVTWKGSTKTYYMGRRYMPFQMDVWK